MTHSKGLAMAFILTMLLFCCQTPGGKHIPTEPGSGLRFDRILTVPETGMRVKASFMREYGEQKPGEEMRKEGFPFDDLVPIPPDTKSIYIHLMIDNSMRMAPYILLGEWKVKYEGVEDVVEMKPVKIYEGNQNLNKRIDCIPPHRVIPGKEAEVTFTLTCKKKGGGLDKLFWLDAHFLKPPMAKAAQGK